MGICLHRNKKANFFKRTNSPSHFCNRMFAPEPCGQGMLRCCHDVDPLYSIPFAKSFGMGTSANELSFNFKDPTPTQYPT